MQLQSLRLFMAVADTGSFSVAAQRRHTVQSNVTAHVKKLERELGVELFTRNGQVAPTPAGHLLVDHARRVLRAHDAALGAFQDTEVPSGVLRIGAMETTAALRLPEVLAAYHARYPRVDLCLTTGTTADMVAAVLDGVLDCAFVAGPVPHPQLYSAEIFRESLVLVTDQPRSGWPTTQELIDMPFLAFKQGCHYRHCIERLLGDRGVYGSRIFEFGSIDGILGCVAAGMGYALLPEAVVAAQQSRFAVHYLALPDHIGDVTTCWAALDKPGWSPALAAFEHSALEVATTDRYSVALAK